MDLGSSFSLSQYQLWWWLLRCTQLSYEVITDENSVSTHLPLGEGKKGAPFKYAFLRLLPQKHSPAPTEDVLVGGQIKG